MRATFSKRSHESEEPLHLPALGDFFQGIIFVTMDPSARHKDCHARSSTSLVINNNELLLVSHRRQDVSRVRYVFVLQCRPTDMRVTIEWPCKIPGRQLRPPLFGRAARHSSSSWSLRIITLCHCPMEIHRLNTNVTIPASAHMP